MADDAAFDEEGTLVLEQRFAVVPELIINALISDCAFRSYVVLLRYGQTSGQRLPRRASLARRLHKNFKDTVDRALDELAGIGAVVVEHRRAGRQNLTDRYHLRSTPPGSDGRAACWSAGADGWAHACGYPDRCGCSTSCASTDRCGYPWRGLRPGWPHRCGPDPGVRTVSNTHPSSSRRARDRRGRRPHRVGSSGCGRRELLELGGIGDLELPAGRCQRLRLGIGRNAALWWQSGSPRC